MNQRTLWAVLAGVSTGLLAGVLLAPKAGKEVISDLSGAAGNWRDKLGEQWQRLLGHSDGHAIEGLAKRQEELVHADFNNPDELPHRPRVESQG